MSFTLDCHGKTWSDALAEFIALYNGILEQRATGATVDIIHGYGSTGAGGTMRVRFRAFLQRYPQHLQYQPGEDLDGNQGHTLVQPRQPLPATADLLAERIWEYCDRPRPLTKITGKFRRHGDAQVLQAVRGLERQRRLRPTGKGRVKTYQAV